MMFYGKRIRIRIGLAPWFRIRIEIKRLIRILIDVNTWWMLGLAPEEPGQRLPLVREQLHGRPEKRRDLHEYF
jgi:hypothetical protein